MLGALQEGLCQLACGVLGAHGPHVGDGTRQPIRKSRLALQAERLWTCSILGSIPRNAQCMNVPAKNVPAKKADFACLSDGDSLLQRMQEQEALSYDMLSARRQCKPRHLSRRAEGTLPQ